MLRFSLYTVRKHGKGRYTLAIDYNETNFPWFCCKQDRDLIKTMVFTIGLGDNQANLFSAKIKGQQHTYRECGYVSIGKALIDEPGFITYFMKQNRLWKWSMNKRRIENSAEKKQFCTVVEKLFIAGWKRRCYSRTCKWVLNNGI